MKHFVGLLIIGLLLSLAAPLAAQDTATPEPTPEALGLRFDAPTYALHGPYWVGTREMQVKTTDGDLPISIWYPALNPNHAAEDITYTVDSSHPWAGGMIVKGHALKDAQPDSASGPFPLVIQWVGLSGPRQLLTYLSEHLASYGFVVINPEPRGESGPDFWEGAYYRPVDTMRVIEFADKLTASGGELAGIINTDKIGIAGGSSGGWGALVSAGAQMNLSGCPVAPAAGADWYSDCAQFLPHQDDLAKMFGYTQTPAGAWPQVYDKRVAAVMAMMPDGDIFGINRESVAAIQVPTMIMTASQDALNTPEFAAYPIYKALTTPTKSLVVLENGNHYLMVPDCSAMPGLVEAGASWFCSDRVWDMNRAHDLMNHFQTAFFMDVLKGDKNAHAALLPDQVDFVGIRYETKGY